MDTITQALLGATVGMACGGARLGRRAAVWGAIGGVIPDLDSVVASPLGPWARLEVHRGSSHSLWFGPVVGSLMAYALWRFWYRRRDPDGAGTKQGLYALVAVLVLGILTHPLLDVCTSYGTQLLAPFSRTRFVVEAIGIIDPAYTLALVAALVVALRRVRDAPRRSVRAASIGLAVSTAYIGVGFVLNLFAVARAERELAERGVEATVTTYSTPFQLLLRRVVARTENDVFIGYTSPLASEAIHWWTFRPAAHPLIDKLRQSPRGRTFEWFAAGQTAGHVEPRDDGWNVEIDDIRYGLPGRPSYGLWGIAARFDRSGELRGEPVRIQRSRGDLGNAVRSLFRAALGNDPNTFKVGVGHANDSGPELSRLGENPRECPSRYPDPLGRFRRDP